MSGTSNLAPATVIGLGPMGRAMAATLMRAGHPVTVWEPYAESRRRARRRGGDAGAHTYGRRRRQ